MNQPLPRAMKAIFYFQRFPEVLAALRWTKSWFKLLRAYLGLGKVDYPFLLNSRSGRQFNLNNYHDVVTIWVIFCRHEYCVPKNAKVIVDLGANFGAFTVLAAETAKEATILSLEPFPVTFNQLQETIKMNSLEDRVICLPWAIAKKNGERLMSLEDGVSQSRGLISETNEIIENYIKVKTVTLQDLTQYISEKLNTKRIDMVKMDIEGSEHEWLPDISANVLENIKEWQMEYHPNHPKQPLFESLQRAGLQCIKDSMTVDNSDSGVAHFRQ